ncbi:MAG: nucleoside recognition domain-containing protein [Bacilli bacterium]
MINKIWGFFIVIGVVFCLFTDNVEIVNNEILEGTKVSFEMIIKIFPVMALWLGIMNIAKKSGLLDKFSTLCKPLLRKIFPEIPKNHESFDYLSSNIVANIFGLGSAATPFGLKAMKLLQDLNDNKQVASRSMITFLVLNTSGLTLIPTTVLSLRTMHNSTNPSFIVIFCIIATTFSTLGGLIMDRIVARRK